MRAFAHNGTIHVAVPVVELTLHDRMQLAIELIQQSPGYKDLNAAQKQEIHAYIERIFKHGHA
jgi:hypothetical protein